MHGLCLLRVIGYTRQWSVGAHGTHYHATLTQGTSTEQDSRFGNKEKKLLKQLKSKFPPEFDTPVDLKKVKLEVIKPWISDRVTELLGRWCGPCEPALGWMLKTGTMSSRGVLLRGSSHVFGKCSFLALLCGPTGIEDDIVIEFIFNTLEKEQKPDPRIMQINLTGFLESKTKVRYRAGAWLQSARDSGTHVWGSVGVAKR